MVSALESPVHEGWKNAIVNATDTDTVFLHSAGPCLRALRTKTTEALEKGEGEAMSTLGEGQKAVYFEGQLEEGVALSGQVAGRIESVRPVVENHCRHGFGNSLRPRMRLRRQNPCLKAYFVFLINSDPSPVLI